MTRDEIKQDREIIAKFSNTVEEIYVRWAAALDEIERLQAQLKPRFDTETSEELK